MFARVAVYEQIDVEGWEPVSKWFKEHADELNRGLAGYQGSMTLLDRENARLVGIGLYDTAANAHEVDEVMDQGPPKGMPQELQDVLARGTRTQRGVYEVMEADGVLGTHQS